MFLQGGGHRGEDLVFQPFDITFHIIESRQIAKKPVGLFVLYSSGLAEVEMGIGIDYPGPRKMFGAGSIRDTHLDIIAVSAEGDLIEGDIIDTATLQLLLQGRMEGRHGLDGDYLTGGPNQPAQIQGKIAQVGADIRAIVAGADKFLKEIDVLGFLPQQAGTEEPLIVRRHESQVTLLA